MISYLLYNYILQFIDNALFWQVHYQILSIVFLKELIELNDENNDNYKYEHGDKKCEACLKS